MGRARTKTSPSSAREWDSAGGRVRWLLHSVWGGNCSAMAQAIGVSPTVINKIDNAGREPGRLVLENIAHHAKVNPAWLLSGAGEPIGGNCEVPIAKRALPGLPQQHPELLTRKIVNMSIFSSPSMYWLILKEGEPITRLASRGFRSGDMLLVEADPQEFPAEEKLLDHLCVVKDSQFREDRYVLGSVGYHEAIDQDEPAYLDVECW